MKKKFVQNIILDPKSFLKFIVATLSFCVLGIGLVVVVFFQPFQTELSTLPQASSTGLDCNQLCTHSSECSINFRCFNLGSESRCRLALNPNSLTCQEFEGQEVNFEKTNSTKGGIGQNTNSIPTPKLSSTQTNPGDDTEQGLGLPLATINPLPSLNTQLPSLLAPSPMEKNNLWNLWLKFNSPDYINNKRLLIAITSTGLILLGLSLIAGSFGKNNKKDNKVIHDSKPKLNHPSGIDEINMNEELSTTPITKLKSNAVPSQVSSAQLYPSGGMTSRLKQKGVELPI